MFFLAKTFSSCVFSLRSWTISGVGKTHSRKGQGTKLPGSSCRQNLCLYGRTCFLCCLVHFLHRSPRSCVALLFPTSQMRKLRHRQVIGFPEGCAVFMGNKDWPTEIGTPQAPLGELCKAAHLPPYFLPLFWEIENKLLTQWCLSFPDGHMGMVVLAFASLIRVFI